MSPFARYIGIDYSGAETADSSCKGTQSGLDKSAIFAPRRPWGSVKSGHLGSPQNRPL
jgi:hypothetical protein